VKQRATTADSLDETLSVVKRLLDLVHSWFNVEAQYLFEPAQHLGLYLGTVPRRDLTFTPTHTHTPVSISIASLSGQFRA